MKEMLKKACRSGLSLLLVACLMLGMCSNGLIVLANDLKDADGDGKINYVALGASNTNGFGLMGYLPDELYGNPVNKNEGTVYGYQMEAEKAYPSLVANALKEMTGKEVELDQLAISSMRAEELHVLLDNDYYGDNYTEWRFTAGHNWFNMAHEDGLDGLREEYQDYVANADVITVDIGSNNFGVYASNRIFNNMFDADFTRFDEGTQRNIATVKAEIAKVLNEHVAGMLTPELSGMLNHIIDTMTYALVGFCVNFDASMERIYELNPDATVVVVNIQNLMHGLYATLPGMEEPFAFGEFYGAIVNMANTYMATVSPYADEYLFAYIGEDGQAETFLKDIQDYTGNPEDLRTAVTDCFDVYDNDMYAKTRVLQALVRMVYEKNPGMVALKDGYKHGLADIADTEKPNAFSDAVYDDAILLGGVNIQEFLTAGANNELPEELQPVYDQYEASLLTVYDTAATFMQLGANSTVLDLAAAAANFATQGKVVLQTMFKMLEASIANPGLKIEETAEFQALANDPTSMAIITLGVRSDLGNSFFSHPNENGHVEIANAIVEAIEEDITGNKVFEGKMFETLKAIAVYLYENGYIEKAQTKLFAYAEEMAEKLAVILEENLKPEAIKRELKELYKELEAETQKLHDKLLELTKQEKEILVGLQDERAALSEKLEDLKAELEAIQNGQMAKSAGYSVMAATTPAELVADLQKAIAETEAAIADLDTAIANLIARIEADKEGVATIEAAIEELKKNIAETETALAEVTAVCEQLNADLKELYEATLVLKDAAVSLYDLTLGQVEIDMEAVVDAAVTIVEKVPAVIEQAKELYDVVLDAAAKAEASVNAIVAFPEKIEAEVKALLQAAEELGSIEAEKIAAIQETLNAFEKILNEFVDENLPKFENALNTICERLEKAFLRRAAKVEALWNEYQDVVYTSVGLAYLYCQKFGYTTQAKKLICCFADMACDYATKLHGKLIEAQDWLDKNLPIAEAKLTAKLDKLCEELADIEAKLGEKLDEETRKALEAACEEIQKQIDCVNAELAKLCAIADEVKAYIDSVNAAINDVLAAADAVYAAGEVVEGDLIALWNALCGLKAELNDVCGSVCDLYDAITEELLVILGLCDIAVDEFVAVLETLPAYAELLKDAADMIAGIEDWFDLSELLGDVLELLDEGLKAKLDELIKQLEDLKNQLQNAAEDAKEQILAKIEEIRNQITEIYNGVIEAIKEAYKNATSADYEMNKDSYYVAIGDDSAVSESYVEKLAAALGVDFNNLAKEGLTVEDAFALIAEQAAEIGKADLITVGFNNVAATTNLFNTITGFGSVDTNWEKLVGAEYSVYVDEALAELKEMLMGEGLDAATAELLMDAVNAYAYTYAAREFCYPELVNAIHAVNPEALVVIVGTYNDLEGVSLNMGGTEIEIGEYVQYLIDAANLQNLIYAMLTENTIYVDAPAVETLFEEAVANGDLQIVGPQSYIMALMMGYMNPSEAGHEYIKEQILNALNVTKIGLLGDVNLDGVVNSSDLNVLYRYIKEDGIELTEMQLAMADVNEDGVVNSSDLNVLYRYIQEDATLGWKPTEIYA